MGNHRMKRSQRNLFIFFGLNNHLYVPVMLLVRFQRIKKVNIVRPFAEKGKLESPSNLSLVLSRKEARRLANSQFERQSETLIQGKTGLWELVIGLEVHAQIQSEQKLFSGQPNE